MANQIYAKLREEFDAKHNKAIENAKRRKSEIFEKFPQFSEFDRQMSLVASEYTMRLVGGEDVSSEMAEKLSALQKAKQNQMSANKIAISDFEPKFDCDKCKDTGVVGNEYCACFKKRLIEENFKNSNVGMNSESQSFEDFDFDYYPDDITGKSPKSPREHMKQNYSKCRDFVDDFDKKQKGLIMLGGTGLGKTYLSTCIAKELLKKGKSVIYISAVDCFKRIEKSRFDSTDEDIRMFEDCDLLIIDDLGTEAPSVYTVAVFSDILDKRIRNGKKMIVSSNSKFSDFEKIYGERVFSRLTGYFDCLLFFGNDIRVQKFMKGN